MLHEEFSVLHADDCPDDRFLLRKAFAAAGMERRLMDVDDGRAVVDYLASGCETARGPGRRPGLLLLDIKMPGMTGLETLEWVRASPRWQCLPVLILTASIAPSDIERAYKSGANAYLAKPSTARELVDIARCLEKFWLERVEFPACAA